MRFPINNPNYDLSNKMWDPKITDEKVFITILHWPRPESMNSGKLFIGDQYPIETSIEGLSGEVRRRELCRSYFA